MRSTQLHSPLLYIWPAIGLLPENDVAVGFPMGFRNRHLLVCVPSAALRWGAAPGGCRRLCSSRPPCSVWGEVSKDPAGRRCVPRLPPAGNGRHTKESGRWGSLQLSGWMPSPSPGHDARNRPRLLPGYEYPSKTRSTCTSVMFNRRGRGTYLEDVDLSRLGGATRPADVDAAV